MPPDESFLDETVSYYSRIRTELWLTRGDIDAFRVQLEYDHEAVADPLSAVSQWKAVARFEHTPNSPSGHDIVEEGLHMDLCGGENRRRLTGFPPVPLSAAPDYCKSYLELRHNELIRAYENRVGVPPAKRKIS